MLKLKLLLAVITISLASLGVGPAQVLALNCNNPTTAAELVECGANDASGNVDPATQDAGAIDRTIERALVILSVVVGIVAVVMIVVAGFRYITSAAEPAKVTAAKNTLMYAIIGLIIVVLAQVIVRFVLKTTTETANNPATQGVCTATPYGYYWVGGPKASERCTP
jgi:heme/copper-type cytochrome/quinol oxidase subunit 2